MLKTLRGLMLVVVMSSMSYGDDILLLDTSGSLSTQKVQSEVISVASTYISEKKDVLGFSDEIYPINKIKDIQFSGSTNLSAALKEAGEANYDYIVLVTDGEPNSEQNTIVEAMKLKDKGIKICSVFVSDSNRIPLVLAKISDEIFYTKDILSSLNLCNDEVKEKLLSAGCDQKPKVKKEKKIRVETVAYKVKNCNSTSSFPVTVRSFPVEVK